MADLSNHNVNIKLARACLDSVELQCPVCENTLREPVSVSCGHSYCRDPCIVAVMTHGNACCIVCGEDVATPLEKLRVSNALCATLVTLRFLAEGNQVPLFTEAPPLLPNPEASLLQMGQGLYGLDAGGANDNYGAALPLEAAPQAQAQAQALPPPIAAAPLAAAAAAEAAAPTIPTPAPPSSTFWECPSCTLENTGPALECVACGRPAPYTQAGAAPLPTKSSASASASSSSSSKSGGGNKSKAAAASAPAASAPVAKTAWERGEYGNIVSKDSEEVEDEQWQPVQKGGKSSGGGVSALSGSSSGSSGSSGGGGGGSGGSGATTNSPLGAAASGGGGGNTASASKLIPLLGDEHPPNAVLKTSGAGSSFSKNGRGGSPGSGLLLKFQDGAQQRGMVLTVVTGAGVRKGSHVHGFIGITRSKNRELFDQIQKTCPEGVREFRNGYVANTRHATLTFQFPDLMLSEEERSHDEFGPEACRIMDSLLSKEVFFEVLWSPRWGRFVAHNVVVIS